MPRPTDDDDFRQAARRLQNNLDTLILPGCGTTTGC